MSILRDALLNIRPHFRQLMPAQPCELCGSMSHDGLWCAACDAALPYLDVAHCPACALPTPGSAVCGHCLRQPPLFTRATAVFGYNFPLDKLIHALKYGERLPLAHALGKKLARCAGQHAPPDCVIPMPLHPAKLRARGFNQSLLLAAVAARELDLKLLPHACCRVRDTPPQTGLPWKERKRNVRGAFECAADLNGKRVALVDDVLTTGASMNALAEAVLKRGAAEVSAWVVARTLPYDLRNK